MSKKELDTDELFKQNNFDLLRLMAACQVAIVHGIEHFNLEFLYPINKYLGLIPGVPIFFFLSGLLISASWERNPNFQSFIGNRFYRIFRTLVLRSFKCFRYYFMHIYFR